MLLQPFKKVIVSFVRTDPDPIKIVFKSPGNGSIGAADGYCPYFSFSLKLERRMIGILYEEAVFLSGQSLNLFRQVGVEFSKARCQK